MSKKTNVKQEQEQEHPECYRTTEALTEQLGFARKLIGSQLRQTTEADQNQFIIAYAVTKLVQNLLKQIQLQQNLEKNTNIHAYIHSQCCSGHWELAQLMDGSFKLYCEKCGEAGIQISGKYDLVSHSCGCQHENGEHE